MEETNSTFLDSLIRTNSFSEERNSNDQAETWRRPGIESTTKRITLTMIKNTASQKERTILQLDQMF